MNTSPGPVLMTNTHRDFYPTLGPFLARHALHRFLGGVPWDEDTKTWIIYRSAEGDVRGFCAVNQTATRSRRTFLESLYILPDEEHLAAQLIHTAVKEFGRHRDLHSTVHREIASYHHQAGFATVKETKHFLTLVRPATIPE